jgi:hypothetical protein
MEMFDEMPDLEMHTLSAEWSSDLLNYGHGPQNDTTASGDNNTMVLSDSDVQTLLAEGDPPSISDIFSNSQQQMAPPTASMPNGVSMGAMDGFMLTSIDNITDTQQQAPFGVMDGGFNIASVATQMVIEPTITSTQQMSQVSMVMLFLLSFCINILIQVSVYLASGVHSYTCQIPEHGEVQVHLNR